MRRRVLFPRQHAVPVRIQRVEVVLMRGALGFGSRNEAVLVLVESPEHGLRAAVRPGSRRAGIARRSVSVRMRAGSANAATIAATIKRLVLMRSSPSDWDKDSTYSAGRKKRAGRKAATQNGWRSLPADVQRTYATLGAEAIGREGMRVAAALRHVAEYRLDLQRKPPCKVLVVVCRGTGPLLFDGRLTQKEKALDE
jgi:hypothetical protein